MVCLRLPQPQAFDMILTMENTHLNKVICSVAPGQDITEWQIRTNDDCSVLATVYASEHLASIVQNAIEADIAKNEATGWEG